MTRQEKMLAQKRGRPATGKGLQIGVRLQPNDLIALDAYVATELDPPSRPQAIRTILADWLRTHGFRKTDKHVEPKGPASEVVKVMDAAIANHRRAKKAKT